MCATAAKPNPQAPVGPTGIAGYAVSRPGGVCAVSGDPIAPGDTFMALLKESPDGFERLDVALTHWPRADPSAALAYWRAVMPAPDAVKKKPFVDDETLVTLFERLADTQEPLKLHFRFVLGLILMRKRVLQYETSDHQHGHDVWVVRKKGTDTRLNLVNPHLTEEQVAAVSSQLGQIMNEEL